MNWMNVIRRLFYGEDWCLPMRYQIGLSTPPHGDDDVIVMHPFMTKTNSVRGRRGYYLNLYIEEGELVEYGPYRKKTGTAHKYKEGVPVFGTPGFFANIDRQVENILRLGGRGAPVDVDNRDAYTNDQMWQVYDYLSKRGLRVIIKNPDRGSEHLLAHQAAVGCLFENGSASPSEARDMCLRVGRTDLVRWYVAFNDGEGGMEWADACRRDIEKNKIPRTGVTYSPSADEYTESIDIFKPVRSF